jgi:Xaa-Pro aminopeptidase
MTTQETVSGLVIPDEEYEARRKAAVEAAAARDLAGLVVWSRGGTGFDFHADVAYLTGQHSLFPVLNDTAGWSGRGQSVLVLPVDGSAVLVTDYVDDPDDRVRVGDVRISLDVPGTVAKVLAELGLDGRPLGLVGRETLTLNWFRKLEAAVGHPLELAPADDILERLRVVKSEAELGFMREAARVGVEWMNVTMEALVEGRTEGDAVGEGLRYLASQGGWPYDIAIASGPKSHHYFGSSGVPHFNSTRKLQTGDLVHCDLWGPVNGYYTDFARSTVIGRRPTDTQRELLEASVAVIHHIIEGAKPGATFHDLYQRGATWLTEHGYAGASSSEEESGNAFSAGFPAFGHSLGHAVETPWITDDEHTVLEPNMVLAIEAVVGRPGLGATNYEHNLVVRDGEPEILTAACKDVWWD